MQIKEIILVIVDISGYTQFIRANKTSILHAEEIISELLEVVIEQSAYPLELNKLEGDAVLMYAETKGNAAAASQDVMRQVQTFFGLFHSKTKELAKDRSSCPCEACQRIRDLRLKVVLHSGDVIFKQIRQFEELAGEDVILIHRLLKNGISADEYILMTERFYKLAQAGIDKQLESREEIYSNFGSIKLRVWPITQ
ncbi:MAG: DUF2652 domain-containing protein [Chloroflexota bacterium]|nr:DUF2652 domain-containing protein [Chloroflexota bacterium]